MTEHLAGPVGAVWADIGRLGSQVSVVAGEVWTGQLVLHSATVVSAGAGSWQLLCPVRRGNERLCVVVQ